MRIWTKWSAWLCLSLLLWTAAAESTHNHPTRTEAASCSICLAAHNASPAPRSVQSTPTFTEFDLFHEEDAVANSRLAFSDLGIRGPPVTL